MSSRWRFWNIALDEIVHEKANLQNAIPLISHPKSQSIEMFIFYTSFLFSLSYKENHFLLLDQALSSSINFVMYKQKQVNILALYFFIYL